MGQGLNTLAVVIEGPERLALDRLALQSPADDDIVVATEWSGISTGTERLLWSGKMPAFPGMGYPLVPGYESVGRIEAVGRHVHNRRIGERVFVPGARCYRDVRGLFGGAASRLVVPATRATPLDESLGENAVLLALAATARHAMAAAHAAPPAGAEGYRVCTPEQDARRDYRAVYDVSGDARILDSLIGRLAPGGEVVLAGFYTDPMSFDFTAAFMREARLRVAAEWKEDDLTAVLRWIAAGRLSLDGLITHRCEANAADQAYRQAFVDPSCLKMILDWRQAA
jgi:3-hydroxyethyl bacteriochlorophyllide a dehydrogenase